MKEAGIERLKKLMELEQNLDGFDKDCPDEVEHNYSWVKHFYEQMGGFSTAVATTKTALGAAQKLFKDSPKYQKTVTTLDGVVPLVMSGYEILSKVKDILKYRRNFKSNEEYVDEESIVLSSILDVKEDDLRYSSPRVPTKVLEWIIENKSTGLMKIEGAMNTKWDVVDTIDTTKDWKLYFVVNIQDVRFAIRMEYNHTFDAIRQARIIHNNKINIRAIRMMLIYSYIESLNYRENIIVLDSDGRSMDVRTLPRQTIEHDVYQLEPKFFSELKKSLKKEKKRGYAFVGRPGVGKTTIVNKMIDELRDIPVIVIPADNSKDPADIMTSLILCQMVSPCMVVFEDIDMLPMQYKDSKHLSTFIEYLDSAKYDAPVIFVATLNEPELIHESLMDRRGRFDKVMVIQPPTRPEDITEVMQNVYHRECGEDLPDILDDKFFNLAIKYELRHSDFTEILNRMVINDMEMTKENAYSVLQDLCNTQETINNFRNRKAAGGDQIPMSMTEFRELAAFVPNGTIADMFKEIDSGSFRKKIGKMNDEIEHRGDKFSEREPGIFEHFDEVSNIGTELEPAPSVTLDVYNPANMLTNGGC